MWSRVPLFAALALLAALGGPVGANAQALPPGAGKTIVETRCTQCHGLDLIVAQRLSPQGWKEIIFRMIEGGAVVSDAELKSVQTYLSTALGPGASNATVAPERPRPAPASAAPSR